MNPRRLLILAVALAGLLLGISVAIWSVYQRIETRPLLETGATEQVLDIPQGTGVAEILARMEAAGLDIHPFALRAYLRLKGIDTRLQAGEYAVLIDDTAATFIQRMVAGAVVQYRLTIIEGWRFTELLAALHAHPAVVPELPADAEPAVIMAALGRPELHPEGQFLPETYLFTRGISEIALLERAHRALLKELNEAWEHRVPNLPLRSAEEALTLASIIEKETGLPEERRQIAGVFTRRLELGMRLQTDPTVIYGLGEDFTGPLRRQHLTTDTPWNTYTRHGLPPTPIAMAGAASIRAAVDPADGDALYFVSRGDGSHAFSATLEAHNAAVRRYILGKED